MGFFSYKCSVDKLSIPAYPWAELPQVLSEVVMVLPDNKVIDGVYNGYGEIVTDTMGKVDMYDELARIMFGKPERDLIFNNRKYITAPDGTETVIEQFNWEEPVEAFGGKSLNQLREQGYGITQDFYKAKPLVRFVRKCNYTGQRYEDLAPSESDEEQGFFYDSKTIFKLQRLAKKLNK